MIKKAIVKIHKKEINNFLSNHGKVGFALLWLFGVPLPILIILYFIFGR